MNIAILAQAITGTAVLSCGGILIVAPYVFGIYYDVELYAIADIAAFATADANNGTAQKTKEDKLEKNMECTISDNTNIKEDCWVFAETTATDETKKYLSVKDFSTTALTTINSTISSTKKYYKIVTSQKLFWTLEKQTNKKILVNQKSVADKKLNLQILAMSYDNHHKSLINDDQYYIGQAEKINGATNNDITKEGEKYICSFDKKNLNECEISNLTSDTNGVTNIGGITFSKHNSSKITNGNFYLIKGKEWYSEFFVTSNKNITNPTTWIKITKLEKAYISDDRLIHFKN